MDGDAMERDEPNAYYRPSAPESDDGRDHGWYESSPDRGGSPRYGAEGGRHAPTWGSGGPSWGGSTWGGAYGSGGGAHAASGTHAAGSHAASSSRDLVPVRHARHAESDDEDEPERKPATRGRRDMPLWQELPLLLVVAFCLAVLIRTFLLQAFFIPSGSMMDTLLVGDRVLVNKIVYDVRTPERGEVIVFRGSDAWESESGQVPAKGLLSSIGRTIGDLVGLSRPGEKDFIKRVIGVPGDRVSCCDVNGNVIVNGKGIVEPYVINNSALDAPKDPRVCRSRQFDEVLVPAGQLFVMGDHRIVSQDSRCKGTVPIENVIGKAFVIVWPSNRWDTLGVPDTFKDVPGPVALGPGRSAGGGEGGEGGGLPAAPALAVAAVTLPILVSLVSSARTGRKRRWGRRTLRA